MRVPKMIFDPSNGLSSQTAVEATPAITQPPLPSPPKKNEEKKRTRGSVGSEASSSTDGALDWSNKDALFDLDISVLQAEARRRGISPKGNKKTLIARILKTKDDYVSVGEYAGSESEEESSSKKAKLTSDSEEEPEVTPKKKATTGVIDSPFFRNYTPSKKSQGKREKQFDPYDPDTWTLSELREFLKLELHINAYDNKQKILERFLGTIKEKLESLISGKSKSDNLEEEVEVVKKKRQPKRNTKKAPQPIYEEPEPATEEEKVQYTELPPVISEPVPIENGNLGSDEKIRMVPPFASPNIHVSFANSYLRKRIINTIDVHSINPKYSQITTSYNFITYDYPKESTEHGMISETSNTIKDTVLQNLVKETMESHSVSDMVNITTLECCSEREADSQFITTLFGLEKLSGLKNIILQGHHISSLFPISKLDNLKEIQMSRNYITHTEYLPPQIEIVNLSFNAIRSLRFPPSICETLVYLNLSYNRMDINIHQLSDLHSLQELDLSGNLLTDETIKPLESASFCKSLKCLRVNNNYLTNLEFLSDYGQLVEFSCVSNFVLDVLPLSHLLSISEINLDDNPPLLLSLHISSKSIDWKTIKMDENLQTLYKTVGESNMKLIHMLLKDSVRIVV